MAHECPECGMSCHCNGDIDDIYWGEDPNCKCAYSEWGCGSEHDTEDQDDDDEYYDYMDKLNEAKDEQKHN